MARLLRLRWATCAAHVLNHVERSRIIMTLAAWHNARQRLTSPAFVMQPETSRSPDWLQEGARPTQGHFLRGREPGRIIYRRTKGQRYNCADPGHRHQALADRVFLGELAHMALQSGQFVPQGRPRTDISNAIMPS